MLDQVVDVTPGLVDSQVGPQVDNFASLATHWENLPAAERVRQLWDMSVSVSEQIKAVGDKALAEGGNLLGEVINYVTSPRTVPFIVGGSMVMILGHELYKRLDDDRKSSWKFFDHGDKNNPVGTLKGQLYFLLPLYPFFSQLGGSISEGFAKSPDLSQAMTNIWANWTTDGNIILPAIVYLGYTFTQKGLVISEGRKRKGMTWGDVFKETGISIKNDFASIPGKVAGIPAAARDKILSMAKSSKKTDSDDLTDTWTGV